MLWWLTVVGGGGGCKRCVRAEFKRIREMKCENESKNDYFCTSKGMIQFFKYDHFCYDLLYYLLTYLFLYIYSYLTHSGLRIAAPFTYAFHFTDSCRLCALTTWHVQPCRLLIPMTHLELYKLLSSTLYCSLLLRINH